MLIIPKSVLFYIELQKTNTDYNDSQRQQVNLFKVLTGVKATQLTYRNPPNAILLDMIKEDGGFTFVREFINPDSRNKYSVYRITDKVIYDTALKVAVTDSSLRDAINKIKVGK